MVTKNNFEILIRKHPKQYYYTFFNRRTGFFMRAEEKGHLEPFWAKDGPELLDISITNWCDKGCSICYRNSSKNGKHITLGDYNYIMRQAEKIGVLQVALGGGNPNQHPDFIKILKITRQKYGIVPSYTTNGRSLTREILKASAKYCGAVAVSAYSPFTEMQTALQKLKEYNIKTNIHYVLTNKTTEIAIEWLQNPPIFLENVNAIIFLNYKSVGKNKNNDLLLKNANIEKFFNLISKDIFSFKIGFDNCCVSGLVTYLNLNPLYYEACESGRFSAFISEELKMYPCSFMVNTSEGVDLRRHKMIDIWRESKIFNQIRKNLKENHCNDKCVHFENCLGGCPLFKEINLCNKFHYD